MNVISLERRPTMFGTSNRFDSATLLDGILADTRTGGGSDGNFTAAETATLYVSSIEPRARLLHRLYQTLR